jgi:hypothetical protein
MKENDSVIEHIHVLKAHLEQLLAIGATLLDDDVVFTLMRSMPPSFSTFNTSLRRYSNLTLKSIIIFNTRRKFYEKYEFKHG